MEKTARLSKSGAGKTPYLVAREKVCYFPRNGGGDESRTRVRK